MYKKHHMQKAKEGTLATIRKWIAEAEELHPGKFVDREALSRQIQLMGASKAKAEEYLDLLEVE